MTESMEVERADRIRTRAAHPSPDVELARLVLELGQELSEDVPAEVHHLAKGEDFAPGEENVAVKLTDGGWHLAFAGGTPGQRARHLPGPLEVPDDATQFVAWWEARQNQDPATPTAAALSTDVRRQLAQALLTLTPSQQVVIRLLVIEDLSVEEVADLMKLPPSAVGPLRARAMSRLRNALLHGEPPRLAHEGRTETSQERPLPSVG